jgi:hypothetical protein
MGFWRFCLYVGVAVSAAPQDWLGGALLFGFWLFFFVCWRVAEVFFFHMLHGNRGMWMWQHVEIAQKSTSPQVINAQHNVGRELS